MRTEKLNKTWDYLLVVDFELTKDKERRHTIQILKWNDILFHKIILWDKVTKEVWIIPPDALEIYDFYKTYLPTDFPYKF